jgi:hypothetical protein
MRKLLKFPARAFSLSRLMLLRKAAQRYHVSSLSIARRAGYLYLRHGFLFQEALKWGLLDPRVSPMAEQGCISPMRLRVIQEMVNPSWWMCLTEDKAAFFAYCNATGLRVAPYLAIFDPHGGWSAAGETLSERSQWECFFEGLPDQFVTKPALGIHGEGFTVYRERPPASELYTRLLSSLSGWIGGSGRVRNDQFGRIVIQSVLRNHSDIRELTGTEALQTARIVTWIDEAGDVQIYLALFKIIVGANLHDNYNYGLSGNLTANIDLATGTLSYATGASPDKIGFSIVSNHPTTGRPISGFCLPHWGEARELVCKAAQLFRPLRAIGWDVAITQDGAMLMEGNSLWDTFNHLVAVASPDRQQQLAALMTSFKVL